MINRAAILLRYKEPAVRWINEADPVIDDPGITMEDVNLDNTLYLIRDEDGEDEETLDRWVRENYQTLFESELEGWYTEPDLWPTDRTLTLFREWFEIECHSVIMDTVGGDIIDDDYD